MVRICIRRCSRLCNSSTRSAQRDRDGVTFRRPPTGLRKLGLLAHITTSVGWLGAVLGFLALAVAAMTGSEVERIRAAYFGMEWTLRYAIVPLSVASLAIGVIQSLIGPWGLLRYWWVVVKLLLTLGATFVLSQYTQTMSHLVGAAADASASISELQGLAFSPVLHASAGALVLLGANILSVYKPRGLTPYGWRREDEQRRKQLDRRAQPTS